MKIAAGHAGLGPRKSRSPKSQSQISSTNGQRRRGTGQGGRSGSHAGRHPSLTPKLTVQPMSQSQLLSTLKGGN